MNGLLNQYSYMSTEKNDTKTESLDYFISNPPSINHLVKMCNDITCVNDLVLVSFSTSSIFVRNISQLQKWKELQWIRYFDSEYIFSFYNNDSITFMAMDGDYNGNRSVIGFIENKNINTLHKIIGSNLTFIHRLEQKKDNLFLFGSRYEIPQCEIYNINDIYNPILIGCHNISEIEIGNHYPPYYEFDDILDYKFHNNFLYHSTIDNKLLVYDFTNISNPVKVKEFEEEYTRICFQDNLLYALKTNQIQVFNNDDPYNPVKIASYEIDQPKSIAVKDDIICIINSENLVLLEVENDEIICRSKYELRDRVKLDFKKIFLYKNYVLVMTESYITGAPDTQTDLFIFDIENKNRIKLQFPVIKLSLIYYYLILPILGISSPFILIIVIVLSIFSVKKVKKSKKNKTEKKYLN